MLLCHPKMQKHSRTVDCLTLDPHTCTFKTQGGKKVDELVGASKEGLLALIKKHAGPPAVQDS